MEEALYPHQVNPVGSMLRMCLESSGDKSQSPNSLKQDELKLEFHYIVFNV